MIVILINDKKNRSDNDKFDENAQKTECGT